MATSEANVDEYSHLSATAEHLMAIDIYFDSPIFLTLLVFILINLRQKYKSRLMDESSLPIKYFQKGLKYAMGSVISSIIVCLIKIFFCNNLLFPWNYDKNSFVTLTDSILLILYSIGKILFYYSITYHVHSKDNHTPMTMSLYIWMALVGIFTIILTIIFFVDDAKTVTKQEIGITEIHNINLSMFMSHDGADYAQLAAILMVIVDAIYFIVLFYLYINRLQKIADNNNSRNIYNNIRSIIITITACLEFWIFAITVAMNWEFKWYLAGFDDFIPNLCLFLMYEGSINDTIYFKLCGLCNNKMGEIIYGNKYVDIIDFDDDIADEHYESEQNTLI